MREALIVNGWNNEIRTTKDIFEISDLIWIETAKALKKILESNLTTDEKISKIKELKWRWNSLIDSLDERWLIKWYFSIDWWIILNEENILSIIRSIHVRAWKTINTLHQEWWIEYIEKLYEDFCYLRWWNLVFRNNKYYFLFDWLEINREEIGITTSINDYEIIDINVNKFKKELYTHYNSINQHLKLFSEYFIWSTINNIIENIEEFLKDISLILNSEIIKTCDEKIKELEAWPDEKYNQKIKKDNYYLLSFAKKALEIINDIKEINNNREWNDYKDLANKVYELVRYLKLENEQIRQVKNVFWIDINSIIRKYINWEINEWLKKLILWFLDAKINILAFMQNLTQILYNKNFLNKNFEWDLILRKEQVEHLSRISPETIEKFRAIQENSTSSNNSNEIVERLNCQIWYYIDILIWDNTEAYLFATNFLSKWLPEINEWKTDKVIDYFEPTFDLLQTLFEWLEDYKENLDKWPRDKYERQKIKNDKRIKDWKEALKIKEFTPWKNKNYTDAKSIILKKLIRLHREENNPLIIIKTAQNAYTRIVNEWYLYTDNLHILNVNYWWSIVWYVAKHIFEKLQSNWRILVNIWNIVYSIYDIKNANDFLTITDYPFNEYIANFNSKEMQEHFRSKNHLLIFDDNTTSWRTLNNLRELAATMWYFWKINIFACRTSYIKELYDDKLSEETILELIQSSAIWTRKTKIWKVKRNYKELVWTYIWNSLFKDHLEREEILSNEWKVLVESIIDK